MLMSRRLFKTRYVINARGGSYDGAVQEAVRLLWLKGYRGHAKVVGHYVTPFAERDWPDNFIGVTHLVRLESYE